MAKTHPHIDTPTLAELEALVANRSDPIAKTYLALHQLVVGTVPEIRYSVDEVDSAVGYGAHQYGYNGWGMAALTPFSKWVSLTLLQGANLPDPLGLMEGTSVMRHVKLSKPEQVEDNSDGIAQLLREAVLLHG